MAVLEKHRMRPQCHHELRKTADPLAGNSHWQSPARLLS
jgi:hypothetical protein